MLTGKTCNFALCALCAWLVGGYQAWGLVIFSIEGPGGVQTLTVKRGQSVDLRVELSTTDGEEVGGVNYTLEFEAADWSLVARDYATYGWLHNDGVFDNSLPLPGNLPALIDNDLFPATATIPDFSLNTGRNIGDPVTGAATVETFTVTLPSQIGNGLYQIAFGTLLAYTELGDGLSTASTGAFELIVIPEPSSLLLLGLSIAAVMRLRRPQ